MKIGIIGFGNMGSAIAGRLKKDYEIFVFDRDKEKTKNSTAMAIAESEVDLVRKSEAVILAVKPQDFDSLLNEIKDSIKNKLVISIVAGIPTGHIENILNGSRVVRVMPNIGAKIGHSVTCLCKGRLATKEDMVFTKALFKNIGKVQDLEEKNMDAATAISGSGPGYYFYLVDSRADEYKLNLGKFQKDFIFSLVKGVEGEGFDSKKAKFLAHWTVVYSELLLKQTGLSAEELRKQVTSKGGTTEAALEVLRNNGTLAEAVKAAVRRAKELSK